jgi:hypothetical protein
MALRFIPGLERSKAQPVTEARVRKLIADAGGGGGGPVAWVDVTGKPSVFPPDAHTQAASTITDFSEAVDDRVAALLAAGANITLTYNDVSNTLTIAASGGSGLSGLATVSVPNNRLEWSETVAATGVTASQRIMVSIGSHLDADENDAEMLDVAAMSAAAGTDQITFEMAFAVPVAGPIKINWMAV